MQKAVLPGFHKESMRCIHMPLNALDILGQSFEAGIALERAAAALVP